MTNFPKGNVLPDQVRNAISAYLKKASHDHPVVISRAMNDIRLNSGRTAMSDEDLKLEIAGEALKVGLNIHFDEPNG